MESHQAKTEDSRFPHGTIAMQMPYFKERGLELSSFFKGSLNLDVSPYSFDLLEPDFFLANQMVTRLSCREFFLLLMFISFT